MNKKIQRLRRAKKGRLSMRSKGVIRLCVNRTPKHIYAQIIGGSGDRVLATASTLDKQLKNSNGGNTDSASAVGHLIAKKAKELGLFRVAFDRSGFKYHGRIKALADAARKEGLDF